MGLAEFFSCTLLAFGAPFCMFVLTIAPSAIRIIIMLAAAFFWLLAMMLSSLLWFAVVPLRSYLVFGMVVAVTFQEIFRYLMYRMLRRSQAWLKEFTENYEAGHKLEVAYVSGLGFGSMSGAFAMCNVLADSVGPGTLGLEGGSEFFFVTSAAMTLCMIMLNTFWTVIFFNGCDENNYVKVAWVIGTHFLVSGLSLLNSEGLYAVTIPASYLVLVISGLFAFWCAGGTCRKLKSSFKVRNSQST